MASRYYASSVRYADLVCVRSRSWVEIPESRTKCSFCARRGETDETAGVVMEADRGR